MCEASPFSRGPPRDARLDGESRHELLLERLHTRRLDIYFRLCGMKEREIFSARSLVELARG